MFVPKPKLFCFNFFEASKFSHFCPLLGGYTSFYKLENKPRSLKVILKNLMFGRKFGFRGPFMIEKKYLML